MCSVARIQMRRGRADAGSRFLRLIAAAVIGASICDPTEETTRSAEVVRPLD
jgi:hypothetical protein